MLIGRTEEIRLLKEAYKSRESEFVAVYGRRRVGKTFLVREVFDYSFTFQHSGIANESMRIQLEAFKRSLISSGDKCCPDIKSWMDAFERLKELIRASKQKKKIVFIDEAAWIDTPKSGFVSALENFWNGWATARKDILLVICASATSWIIKKVFRNRGGLHNRVTYKIPLAPFTLKECELYAKMQGLRLNRYQLLNLYLAMGGVALYWKMLDKRFSAAQNIDLLFFGPKAKLRGEFNELYDSLYKNPEPYKAIINMLGRTSGGLSRQELISKLGVNDNGAFSEKLEELEECGFIICSKDYPKNKRDSIYKLFDNYSIFYFKYIKENENIDGFWTSAANSQGVKAWSGLAFERVCLQHVPQIKKALGIAAVASRQHGWHSDSSQLEKGEHGVQIDLIIDRADNIVNLCEMKWASDEYVIDKKYDEELRHKSDVFCRQTKIKKAVHLTMITTFGVKHNIYFDSIQSQVVLDQLFE